MYIHIHVSFSYSGAKTMALSKKYFDMISSTVSLQISLGKFFEITVNVATLTS